MTEKEKQTLSDHFERVLESLLARVSVSAASGGQAVKMAVACSGGPDSMVLLDLAAAWAEKNAACLFAFHVHHGLNEKADAWLLHCEDACKKRGVAFDSRRVVPDIAGGTGLEAAARGARYAALAEMCRVHGVGLLLTAHHEDDQAETVLLQLMRGAGVAGLCGMGILGDIPDAGGDDAPRLVRPLLDVPKSALEAWAQERGLVFVVDDSNEDVRFARNAVRQKLAPLLAEYFPGFEKRIARSAGHLQSAQRLLDAMAQADLAGCSDGDALDISRMTHLGQDRFDNLLRFWMSSRGMKMPSTAWLAEAQRQLTGARDDAQVQLAHDGMLFRRYRHHLYLEETAKDAPETDAGGEPFYWQGETRLDKGKGAFLFEYADTGLDENWLRLQALRIGRYQGAARLKPADNRPSRRLKQLFQEAGIPPWERAGLPLLYAGEHLLFVPEIGLSAAFSGKGENRVLIRWISGQAGF